MEKSSLGESALTRLDKHELPMLILRHNIWFIIDLGLMKKRKIFISNRESNFKLKRPEQTIFTRPDPIFVI